MFLVEIWNGNIRGSGADFRVSDQYLALENPWVEGLINISGINYAVDTSHGGMIRASYGSISLLPTIHCEDYIGIRISYTLSNQAAATVLYNGVAFVKSRTRTELSFDLFSDAPNVQIDADINYTAGTYPNLDGSGDTDWSLVSIFQAYCDSVLPSPWTLNSDDADLNTHVDFVARSGQLFSDMLSNLCRTFGHYFVVDYETTTIFLRRVNRGAGSVVAITSFEFYPSRYTYAIPSSKITVGDYVKHTTKGYYFGKPMNLGSFGGTAETIYANWIMSLYEDEPEQFELFMPMEYFAKKGLNFIDKNLVQWEEDTVVFSGGVTTKTFNMVMLGVSFDVQNNKATISGRLVHPTDAQ